MRILVIALPGIGDSLLSTPALAVAKRFSPELTIDVLVMFRGSEEVFRRNRNVNEVLYFNFMKEGVIKSLKFVRSLRGKYDATLNIYPSNRKEYNLISFLIGAKKRAAVKYSHVDGKELGFLNNVRIVEDSRLHNVQENIRLFGKLLGGSFSDEPGLDFPLSDAERKYAEQFCAERGIGKDSLVIGFHPGGSTLKNHLNKRWPPDRFAELGKLLVDRLGARVMIFGGPEEKDLRDGIVRKIGSVSVFSADVQTMGQSAALIERCSVFVSNDSSLLHFSSALRRKTVLLMGPINPVYSGPWGTDYRIASLYLDCSPCFYYSPRPLTCSRTDVKFKCMKELPAEAVYSSIADLLGK